MDTNVTVTGMRWKDGKLQQCIKHVNGTLVWCNVEEEVQKSAGFTERFDDSDFKPHAIEPAHSASVFPKPGKQIDMDLPKGTTLEEVTESLRRGMRLHAQLIRILGGEPSFVKSSGVYFNGNTALYEAMGLIVEAVGEPWASVRDSLHPGRRP